jgi:hypothetical protein
MVGRREGPPVRDVVWDGTKVWFAVVGDVVGPRVGYPVG